MSNVHRLLAVAALLCAAPAVADIAGGGDPATDCLVVLRGLTPTGAVGKKKHRIPVVECQDGDAACDADGESQGSCTFAFRVCADEPGMASCTPGEIRTFRSRKGGLLLPPGGTAEATCAEPSTVVVPVRRKRRKPSVIDVAAIGAERGRRDVDRVRLACRAAPPPSCPENPGGPSEETLVVRGGDLDSGWTGTSFNFPIASGVEVSLCLADCDLASDSVCTVDGITGLGSANGATLGPPLPLVAGGVAVCVVNRFARTGSGGISGSLDLATGAAEASVDLEADVHITDRGRECPRCENGKCDNGANKGNPCVVHGEVEVAESFATNKLFKLSRDCPPAAEQRIATLEIPLRLTTGTAETPVTPGSRFPCDGPRGRGIPPQHDNCGGGSCGATCTACEGRVPNPSDPDQLVCRDVKGGLAQVCCANNTAVSCHPTARGGPGIVRTGRAAPPVPAWPDPALPKTAAGTVLAATFCIPATGTNTVDTTTGLPGPGALLLEADATIRGGAR